MRWEITGGERVTMRLRDGVLTHVRGSGPAAAEPDVTFALAEADLRGVLLGTLGPSDLAARDGVEVTGDTAKLTELLGHLGAPDPDFAIVTP
ncbi:alkyl sulfatase C-terminal domain-containing protein [Streptomyces pyxinicus]|uniref:alkyl sulfatase C-terminal domain-containing protein n=1 Tax=Streptomyces pyxinicus TaxID=2970331 RepID=UPI003D179BED